MGLGMNVAINTDPVDAIIGRLPELDSLNAELCADDIDDIAEMAVPIRTGFLAASGGIWRSGPQWINYFKAGYAYFVEMGTRFMRSQSFLRISLVLVDWIGNVARAAREVGL